MPLTIGSNIASLGAQRRLNSASTELSSVFERLSSGQRINRASDDAAGLAIADTLETTSRIFNQGVRNLSDGISLLNIADSALENLSGIVVRLEELATQAANGVYSQKQRAALDTEAQELKKEFFRISRVTEFNDQKILTGENREVTLQAGVGSNAVLTASIGGAVGTGSFGASTSFSTEPTSSSAVRMGDLNGDGISDLVTAGYDASDGFATVRLGTGTGTFGAATTYTTEGTSSRALSLSDLNGDGILDLITAGDDTSVGYATIRLGTGTGTFGAATSYTTEGTISYALSVGDVNGDGRLDLVTAGIGGGVGYSTVRLGTGTGTFGAATSYTTEATSSRALTLGDLNGDGILDLVTAGIGGGAGYSTVRLGTGSGTFGAATSFAMDATSSRAISVGDLNGDGTLDLVTAGNGGGAGQSTVRLGTGAGSFGAATSYVAEGTSTRGMTLGDLNGDGILDMITAGHSGGAGRATVRLGSGSGTFATATSFTTEVGITLAITTGDLNSDGVLDLVTGGGDGSSGRATIRLSETVSGVAPLLSFSLATIADARQALPMFQAKHQLLIKQRGEIGAAQSRIAVATNVLQVSSENYKAAESRIRDADIANESSKLVRLNILQKAASSVLAQANQQPKIALSLLR